MARKIIVIGAGAAGLMAATAAAQQGAQVTVLEQNEKAGKKIYITGKGRCNFTNACETQDFFANVPRNPKFLFSAIYGFDQQAVINYMETHGCPTKVERGKRAFPVSDHASDITKALTDDLHEKHVKILYHTKVAGVTAEDNRATGVVLADGRVLKADKVIICTGGISYPATGSTGDGYEFAAALGHTIRATSPSLVPFELKESWVKDLQGLSLKNVSVSVTADPIPENNANREKAEQNPKPAEKGKRGRKKNKPVYEGFGEMLFTHFGISGPLILSASSYCDFAENPQGYICHLNLKPALTREQLINRLHNEFELAPGKELSNAVRPLFPERLAEVVANLFFDKTGTDRFRKVRTLTESEISLLSDLICNIELHISGTRGYSEAIITRGGVSVNEIDPSTMESKLISGLYFAGEVIDVDALTGGFNLQIAWSTGHLAGQSAAED